MVNKIIQAVLAITALLLAFWLYNIIMDPIKFEEERVKRYQEVVDRMKDVRDAQIAFKDVNNHYASDFDELISFLDTGEFTLTQRRDSTYMEYDDLYKQDRPKEIIVIDTLGYVSVKDSIFDDGYDYSKLRLIPLIFAPEKKVEFEMASEIIEKEGGIRVPVFELIAKKEVVLEGLNKQYYQDDKDLKVGSLVDASTNGNWKPEYERIEEEE